MTAAVSIAQSGLNNTTFKNRIINGAMMIDQRATPLTATGFSVDRWQYAAAQSAKATVQQNAGSVTPPVGFTAYVGATSSSAYTPLSTEYFDLQQGIEATNFGDLGFGTASASAVTVSFWVRSSLTGLLGGAFGNYAGNRAYPFIFTMNTANTWEYKTITIPGDTSGTWVSTGTGGAAVLRFDLGNGSNGRAAAGAWTGTSSIYGPTGIQNIVGTSGATFYITGVQLEKGSTATSFDYRPYGTELALCQRYFQTQLRGWATAWAAGMNNFSTVFAVPKRASPTLTFYAGTSGTYNRTNSGFVRNETGSTNIAVITGLADASSCTGDYTSPAGAANMRVLLDASSEL